LRVWQVWQCSEQCVQTSKCHLSNIYPMNDVQNFQTPPSDFVHEPPKALPNFLPVTH
jgi:hypothetical protein